MNNYVYAGGLSVFGLAIGGYLLYSKFKKQKQNLIDVPPPPVPKTSTELKLFPKLFGFIKELLNEVDMIHKEMFHFGCRLEEDLIY